MSACINSQNNFHQDELGEFILSYIWASRVRDDVSPLFHLRWPLFQQLGHERSVSEGGIDGQGAGYLYEANAVTPVSYCTAGPSASGCHARETVESRGASKARPDLKQYVNVRYT